MTATAEVTIFTKRSTANDPNGVLLSKRIALGPDGVPVSDGSPCRMATGTGITVSVQNAGALAGVIDGMQPCNALALGSINSGNNGTPVQVVTAKKLAELSAIQSARDSIARTREHIIYRPGVPAWMLLDLDRKGMPPHVQTQLDLAGDYRNALLQVVPGLADAERVTRASTSAGLQHRETGERYKGSGGQHDYVLVKDGADIARALKALHDRCWQHGLGWFLIGGAGQLLERSIVDASVYGSERLVFEGPPDIVPPLLQDKNARACRPAGGMAIDTRTVVPDLTAEEKQAIAALKAAQRQVLEPQAQPIRAAADQRLVDDLIARTGMPRANALRQVQARHRGVLGPEIMLTTDHHGALSVGQILAEPDKYIGETLCDPMEGPAYGYGKARVMRSTREPDGVFIHSFAHGGATFDLKHNFNSARRLLEAAPVAELGNVLCEVVAAADLEEDEVRQLLALCADRAPKVGLRAFTRRVKDDRLRRQKARKLAAEKARRAGGVLDQRLRRPLPPTDGEVTPVVMDIDRVLGKDDGDHPPMRRPDGSLVEVRMQVPFDLHQLTAATANAEADTPSIPAPPELLLAAMTPITVNMMIEKYLIWEKADKDGLFLYNGVLGERYIKSLMQLKPEESGLPHIRAVVTAPMILGNGELLDGIGLDRGSGLYYAIEPSMRGCLPAGEITADDVREAVRFLLDEWLVDVLAGRQGKLVFVALSLSIIERHLLPERPAFLVTAGQRGGGKTTAIHMAVKAVLGRMASATSWSTEPEERRKALFAHARDGVAVLAWDNLAAGTEIACPHIERSLTSPTIDDRILGESRRGTASATCIQIFSVNNGHFGGDMASRGLVTRLFTDDPRPEDRHVEHADPLGWTQANRARILRSFYTILIYGCQNRPEGQEAKTRFKTWWRLVGWPVELAASLLDSPVALDFTALFKQTEEHDTQAAGIATALKLLGQQFGSAGRGSKASDNVWFMARDIRGLLDAGEQARAQMQKSGAQTPADAAAIATADAFLEMIENLTERRQRSPSTKTIGKSLGKIVDRPVDVDETTVGILRTRLLHGDRQFHIETHDGARPASDRAEADDKSTPEGAEIDFRTPDEPSETDMFEMEI
jgi:hypothetical protein